MSKKGKILVTGGTGYIGSHTVVTLQEAGYEVIVLDNLCNSKIQVLNNIQKITGIKPDFINVNLADKESLIEATKIHTDIIGVIHFAALKAVGESVEKPFAYYQNNIVGMLNLLDFMLAKKIPNLVFSSSCTVYGQPDALPVTENSPKKKPESPYGMTKTMCEDIIDDISKVNDMSAINLRYFNPIGAHPTALIGEEPLGPPNNVMPVITQVAAGKREKMTVFGNDYPTPDGTCIRDYIHVVDLAKAHLIALERLLENKNKSKCEFFNLGTGKGFSVLELILAFEKISGLKLNYSIGQRRAGDVIQIYADTTFANQELGWVAQEDIDSMVSSSWKWERTLSTK